MITKINNFVNGNQIILREILGTHKSNVELT